MLSNLNRIVARRCNVLKGRNNTRNLASYLAAIDEGTSSTRFVISDKEGNIVTSVQKELTQHHPVAGHSEHDAMEIWDLTKSCMNEALIESGLKSSDIAAIGITNQRETTLVWNKHTGKPYHNAIVWNDNRTANICQKLMKGTDDINVYKQITGLPLAPYFSGTKLMYLLETVPGLREDAEKGDALFGTIDSWLVYKLTGGKVHVTDVTNASRTLLMDINTCSWSEHMMNELNIPSKMLPKIVASAMEVGSIASENEELQSGGVNAFQGVKIAGILGDQQSALFGQTCFDYKDIKVTYGTGAFLLMNTGEKIVQSTHGLLTTVAYQLSPNDPPTYALEGSCAYAGATLQWCRDNADLMTDIAAEIETAARSASGTDIDDFEKMEEEITFEEEEEDVIFVPAFSGLYAPHWKSDARGLLIGLTAHHNKNDMLKAALESSAYSVMDVIEAMDKDVHLGSDEEPSDSDANSIKVDGGMAYNKYLMQFQANILNKVIHIPVNMSNMTAMGALYAAGIGCGLYTHNSLPTSSNPDSSKPESSFKDELRQIWKLQSEFYPHMSASRRKFKVDKWHKAIERSCGWAAPPGK